MIEMKNSNRHLKYIEKLMRGLPTTQAEFECYIKYLSQKDYKNAKSNSRKDQRHHHLKP